MFVLEDTSFTIEWDVACLLKETCVGAEMNSVIYTGNIAFICHEGFYRRCDLSYGDKGSQGANNPFFFFF